MAEPAPEQPTPVDELTEAVQRFIARTEDEAGVVVGAVLVVELARFGDEGEELRRVTYTTPGMGASMSGTLGLLAVGAELVMRDLVGYDDEE